MLFPELSATSSSADTDWSLLHNRWFYIDMYTVYQVIIRTTEQTSFADDYLEVGFKSCLRGNSTKMTQRMLQINPAIIYNNIQEMAF